MINVHSSADPSIAWDKLLLQNQMKNIKRDTKWDQKRLNAVKQIHNVHNIQQIPPAYKHYQTQNRGNDGYQPQFHAILKHWIKGSSSILKHNIYQLYLKCDWLFDIYINHNYNVSLKTVKKVRNKTKQCAVFRTIINGKLFFYKSTFCRCQRF